MSAGHIRPVFTMVCLTLATHITPADKSQGNQMYSTVVGERDSKINSEKKQHLTQKLSEQQVLSCALLSVQAIVYLMTIILYTTLSFSDTNVKTDQR